MGHENGAVNLQILSAGEIFDKSFSFQSYRGNVASLWNLGDWVLHTFPSTVLTTSQRYKRASICRPGGANLTIFVCAQEGNSRRGVRGGVTCMCIVQRPSASYLVSGGHGDMFDLEI